MKLLIADDDRDFRQTLRFITNRWGYECLETDNGRTAWELLNRPDAPRIAILDWLMPGLNGLDVCRQVRERRATEPTYLLLITGRSNQADVVAGLEAGADDYLTKPFDPDELRARLNIGQRMIDLQQAMANRVRELEDALAHIKHLHTLLPICAWCKKIRDDQNYWQQVDHYIAHHFDIQFTHGVCPECFAKAIEERDLIKH